MTWTESGDIRNWRKMHETEQSRDVAAARDLPLGRLPYHDVDTARYLNKQYYCPADFT